MFLFLDRLLCPGTDQWIKKARPEQFTLQLYRMSDVQIYSIFRRGHRRILHPVRRLLPLCHMRKEVCPCRQMRHTFWLEETSLVNPVQCLNNKQPLLVGIIIYFINIFNRLLSFSVTGKFSRGKRIRVGMQKKYEEARLVQEKRCPWKLLFCNNRKGLNIPKNFIEFFIVVDYQYLNFMHFMLTLEQQSTKTHRSSHMKLVWLIILLYNIAIKVWHATPSSHVAHLGIPTANIHLLTGDQADNGRTGSGVGTRFLSKSFTDVFGISHDSYITPCRRGSGNYRRLQEIHSRCRDIKYACVNTVDVLDIGWDIVKHQRALTDFNRIR